MVLYSIIASIIRSSIVEPIQILHWFLQRVQLVQYNMPGFEAYGSANGFENCVANLNNSPGSTGASAYGFIWVVIIPKLPIALQLVILPMIRHGLCR